MREQFNEEIELMGNRMSCLQSKNLQMRYINDYRAWIEYKPDALYDVSVYQILEKSVRYPKITGLLCYIPGPTGSPWEGARIPMTLRYNDTDAYRRQPKCKMPAGLFHTNVYPSGTVCVHTLNEEESWSPEITFPEIIFSVQQWLSHPYFQSPSNSTSYNMYAKYGIDVYNKRVKEEAKKYFNLTGHHPKVKEMIHQDKERVPEEDIAEIARKIGIQRGNAEKPIPKPSPPEFKVGKRPYNDCTCSCCAWGQTFWDEKRKKRYLSIRMLVIILSS